MMARRSLSNRLKRLTYTLVVGFVLCEIVLRIFGSDEGHVITFFDRYQIPQPRTETYWDSCFNSYQDSSGYGRYDARLGWTINANAQSLDGLYQSNAQGIRDTRNFSAVVDSGVFRIAVFGDSFTHGNEVDNDNTWPTRLEHHLNQLGIKAEVLNFGVMSYGTDQAYLRWQEDGRTFAPDLVIYGLQTENLFRNLNLFRPNYVPGAGITLSKPRYRLEGENLVLENCPTPIPDQLPEKLPTYTNAKESPHEHFHDMSLQQSLTDHSYVMLVAKHVWRKLAGKQQNRTDIASEIEGQDLLLAIIQQFRRDVKEEGSEWLIVQIPNARDIDAINAEGQLAYENMFQKLDSLKHPLVRTDGNLSAIQQRGDTIFQPHYTPEANDAVGRAVADYLAARNDLR